jgi:hypothetical protein
VIRKRRRGEGGERREERGEEREERGTDSQGGFDRLMGERARARATVWACNSGLSI